MDRMGLNVEHESLKVTPAKIVFLNISVFFGISDMDRMGLKVEQEGLKFTHANRTLVISYTKPGVLQCVAVCCRVL